MNRGRWLTFVGLLGACVVGTVACAGSKTGHSTTKQPTPVGSQPLPMTDPDAIQIDDKRLDAPLLRAIAALPKQGAVLDGLSQAARSDLTEQLNTLSENDKKELKTGKAALVYNFPLLFLMVGQSSPEANFLLGCRGGASRHLLQVRGKSTNLDDLPTTIRSISVRAATAYARGILLRALKGHSVKLKEALLLDEVARVLQKPSLAKASRLYAVELDPSFHRKANVVTAAAQDADSKTAHQYLSQLVPSSPEESQELEFAKEAVDQLDSFLKLQKKQPTQALEIAVFAAKLGMYDKVPKLLAQSTQKPESNLKAAAALAVSRLQGSVCGGLELSQESQTLCPIVWKLNQQLPQARSLLETAYQSKQGRDPWSVETYVGLIHVLPLAFTMASATPSEAERIFGENARGVARVMASEGAPKAPRGAAITLFIDLIHQAFVATRLSESGRPILKESARSTLYDRSLALAKSHPNDDAVRRVVLANAMVLNGQGDVTELVKQLPQKGTQHILRARVGAVVGTYNNIKELRDPAVVALEHPPAETPTVEEWRTRVLATEIRIVSGTVDIAQAKTFLETDMPPRTSWIDYAQRIIDYMGLSSRTNQHAVAEKIFTEQASQLPPPPAHDETAREAVGVLEAVGEALMSKHDNDNTRQKVSRRLLGKIQTISIAKNPELFLYRGLLLYPLLDGYERKACNNKGKCVREVNQKLKQLSENMVKAAQAMNPKIIPMIIAGFFPLGGSSSISINYGVQFGIGMKVSSTPRILVLPIPPAPPAALLRKLKPKAK
jgi:hypothetical protein